MARTARVVVPGHAYHLTHRGNHREAVFSSDEDRLSYRRRLARFARRYVMDIWAYCLMTNHVHLLVVGHREDSLARAVGNAHREHSREINQRNGWTGHLWANRFYSTVLDENHLWTAVRYVETNPIRAGIVTRAIDYPWSSARAHVGLESDGLLASDRPFPGPIVDWSTWLDTGFAESRFDEIRRNTSTGRPSGSLEFRRRIESLLGRSLVPRRPGRKRKTRK